MGRYKPESDGVKDMLDKLGLEHVGRPHSGIDDSRNVAKAAIKLM